MHDLEFDPFAKIKKAMVYTGDGFYVSGNDPGLWKKILNKNPDDEKALYHVGLSLEKDAARYLQRYRETNIKLFSRIYRQKIAQSLEMLERSFEKGYFPASIEMQRLKGLVIRDRASSRTGIFPAWPLYAFLLLSCFALGMLIALFFFTDRVYISRELYQERYTYMLPYEVVEGRPLYIPGMDYETRVVEISGDFSRESVANRLVAEVKALYEKDPVTPKMVVGVQESGAGRAEVGMALWDGRNSNIMVYLYQNRKQLLWETTTVIRSALYQFARQNGRLPGDLTDLARPYPNNYLASIPRDPYKYSNAVYPFYNGRGGWVYRPEEFATERSMVSVLRPNVPAGHIDFKPLHLQVDKAGNTLRVVSGGIVLRCYRVALGKEDQTPEGAFFIAKKVVNPNKGLPEEKKLYGTRAMELSGGHYAIHGTDVSSVIGKNVTMGCIRLDNTDMERLYSIVPLYTTVKIIRAGDGLNYEAAGAGDGDQINLYDTRAAPSEESSAAYAWAG
ncbi:MAG: L,D-transpeptidase [Bacillota bacterium]